MLKSSHTTLHRRRDQAHISRSFVAVRVCVCVIHLREDLTAKRAVNLNRRQVLYCTGTMRLPLLWSTGGIRMTPAGQARDCITLHKKLRTSIGEESPFVPLDKTDIYYIYIYISCHVLSLGVGGLNCTWRPRNTPAKPLSRSN